MVMTMQRKKKEVSPNSDKSDFWHIVMTWLEEALDGSSMVRDREFRASLRWRFEVSKLFNPSTVYWKNCKGSIDLTHSWRNVKTKYSQLLTKFLDEIQPSKPVCLLRIGDKSSTKAFLAAELKETVPKVLASLLMMCCRWQLNLNSVLHKDVLKKPTMFGK